MTVRGGSAAMAGTEAEAPAGAASVVPRQAGPDRAEGLWQATIGLLPAAMTAAVIAIGLTTPSYWRDEAATIAAVRRPARDLLHMLGNVDAVHGA